MAYGNQDKVKKQDKVEQGIEEIIVGDEVLEKGAKTPASKPKNPLTGEVKEMAEEDYFVGPPTELEYDESQFELESLVSGVYQAYGDSVGVDMVNYYKGWDDVWKKSKSIGETHPAYFMMKSAIEPGNPNARRDYELSLKMLDAHRENVDPYRYLNDNERAYAQGWMGLHGAPMDHRSHSQKAFEYNYDTQFMSEEGQQMEAYNKELSLEVGIKMRPMHTKIMMLKNKAGEKLFGADVTYTDSVKDSTGGGY
tara:strand:+ start:63 stop:818 length:756 start_codon:yes stop_codon:yes gene_type:complete